jgi:nucleoside-diphosphate-sugar epimerase
MGRQKDLLLVHLAPRPGEVKRLYADIGYAKAVLGFGPRYDLRRSLTELIECYKQGHYEEWRTYMGAS